MKQKDPIWNFFAVVEQDNKTSASSIDCKTVVSAKAPRLRAHREKCLANRFHLTEFNIKVNLNQS